MSNEITTAMVDTFNEGLEMLAQQEQSMLLSRVRRESKTGERNAFDQLGSVKARKVTERHGDTQYVNSPHRRRWVDGDTFDVADLLDKADIIRILNDPGGDYARNFIAAVNREIDTEIVDAALRSAFQGKKGTEVVALPAGQVIVDGGTGFTLTKVKSAMRILKAGNVVQGMPTDLTIAWTSAQEEEFLGLNEVTSIDYNTQRVLVAGGLDGKFYGFEYVRLEDWIDDTDGALYRILPKAGTVRTCVAWRRDGLLLNMPAPPRTRVDELPNKRYAQQIYSWADFGGTRMQEKKVVQIDVQEP